MAPAFRMATRPAVSENMSQFTVDFIGEKAGLLRLNFLPGQKPRPSGHHGNSYDCLLTGSLFSVPRAPEIDVSSCVVRDNSITVAWRPSDGDGPIERYDLEHRKANRGGALRAAGEASWEKISDITDTQVTLSGEKTPPGVMSLSLVA